MKNWFLIACCTAAASVFFLFFEKNSQNNFLETENESQEIQQKVARRDWWQRRYADPTTGEIPYERLATAQKFADSLRQNVAAERSGFSSLTWQERGPSNIGGHLNALEFDRRDASGNTAFIATNGGGLWQASQIFTAPQPLFSKIGGNALPTRVSAVRQNPKNLNQIFAATYAPGGLWRSNDSGENWQKIRPTSAGVAYYTRIDLEFSKTGTLLAADQSTVLRSTDGGASWQITLSGQQMQDLEIAADGKIWLLTGQQIFMSTDDGLTWQSRSTGFVGNNYFACGRIAAAPSNPSKIYVLLPNPSNNYSPFNFFKTENGGAAWQKVAMPSICTGVSWATALAVDPSNDSRVFAGSLGWTISQNSGATWAKFGQNLHADQQCILFHPTDFSKILIGNDGGLARSSNANATAPTCEHINSGLAVSENYTLAMHPAADSPIFITGMQDNGTHRVADANFSNSEKWLTGGDGGFCHFDSDQPNLQIASSQGNLRWLTTNNWLNYSSLGIGGGEFIAASDYDSERNILYTPQPTRGGYAFVRNVGTTNEVVKINFPTTLNVPFFNVLTAVRISPNDPTMVYFGNADGYIFKAKNAASAAPEVSVLRRPTATSRSVSSIEIEKGNENHLAISYSNFGVVSVEESFDGGSTWQNIEGNLPDLPVNWFIFNPLNSRQALVATELGVWATENLVGAATLWLPASGGMNPNVSVQQLVFRPSDKIVAAATFGRGVFATDFFKNQNPPPPALPDLTGVSMSSPQKAVAGSVVSVNFSVKNLGAVASAASNFSIFLSKNSSPQAGDLLLASGNLPAILPTKSYSTIAQILLPATVAAGNWFLILKFDPANQIAESNENNNLIFSSLQVEAAAVADCSSWSDFPWHEWISGVSLANLNHSSGKSAFGNHLDQIANLLAGRESDLRLTCGFSYYSFDEFWRVWIDFDQNGLFDSASELVFAATADRPPHGTLSNPIFGKISVPAAAKTGRTKMRVSMKRGSPPLPCEVLPFGEVEDYSVEIAAPLEPGGVLTQKLAAAEVSVFPNPTSGRLFFQPKNGLAGEVLFEIFGQAGRREFSRRYFLDGKSAVELDVSGLLNGVYFLRVSGAGWRVFTEKFVVEAGF